MKEYVNFYETLKEAHMRLRGTVILYDGVPYYVHAITNHKSDAIFRIYIEPIGWDPGVRRETPDYNSYMPESSELGEYLDRWLDSHPNTTVLRKSMNSALFNKFRPVPLGMSNIGKQVYYIERQPVRPRTEQGLTGNMCQSTRVCLLLDKPDGMPGAPRMDVTSPSFKACVLGDHPSANEVLSALVSGEYDNEAVAFHREFAFLRGPIGMVFLAYKTDIVGVLPKNDFEYLRLGKEFRHTKEVIEALGLFQNII